MNLKDFAEGWLNYARATVDPGSLSNEAKEKVEKRAEICKACPEYQSLVPKGTSGPLQGRCRKCGCTFPAMVYAIGKTCPLNKW
jgi:hypothetical protein